MPIEKENTTFDCYSHNLETNDILYSKLVCKLESLPDNLLQYLPLYSRVLTEIGTQKSTFGDLGLNIGAYTGGVRASTHLQESLDNDEGIKLLVITGRATKNNISKLCELLNEIVFYKYPRQKALDRPILSFFTINRPR